MWRVFVIGALCLWATHGNAQQTPRAIAEAFLTAAAQGQVANGYKKLFEGSNITGNQAAGIRSRTEAALPTYGKALGIELLREEQFGPSLSRLVYMIKSERHPTLWEFYFYKPANRWFVAEVNFSEKFTMLNSGGR